MTKFLLILTIFLTTNTFARGINDIKQVRAVKNMIAKDHLLRVDGLNGVGIGGCDPKTGKESNFRGDFEYCVHVLTENQEAYEIMTHIYPKGERFKNVYVLVRLTGPIVIQPRLSVGN